MKERKLLRVAFACQGGKTSYDVSMLARKHIPNIEVVHAGIPVTLAPLKASFMMEEADRVYSFMSPQVERVYSPYFPHGVRFVPFDEIRANIDDAIRKQANGNADLLFTLAVKKHLANNR